MFTYKGRTSDEMFLKIESGLDFSSPARDINLLAVPGRDGDVVLDNGRYNSVVRTVPCRLFLPENSNIENAVENIHNWLNVDIGYHDFEWSGDSDFVYKALVHESFNTHRVLNKYGRIVLNFRLHPIKYLRSSLTERSVQNNTNIQNPYNIDAKPLIRILGSGNIIIRVAGQELRLRGIANGGCIVDSETQTITSLDGRMTLFDRMESYPFPVLRPGNNTITAHNGVQLFITPRLGALV